MRALSEPKPGSARAADAAPRPYRPRATDGRRRHRRSPRQCGRCPGRARPCCGESGESRAACERRRPTPRIGGGQAPGVEGPEPLTYPQRAEERLLDRELLIEAEADEQSEWVLGDQAVAAGSSVHSRTGAGPGLGIPTSLPEGRPDVPSGLPGNRLAEVRSRFGHDGRNRAPAGGTTGGTPAHPWAGCGLHCEVMAITSALAVPPEEIDRRRTFWVACAGLAIVTAALMVAIVVLTRGTLTYIIDDAYIHLSMARTFATTGTWGVVPGDWNRRTRHRAGSCCWPPSSRSCRR